MFAVSLSEEPDDFAGELCLGAEFVRRLFEAGAEDVSLEFGDGISGGETVGCDLGGELAIGVETGEMSGGGRIHEDLFDSGV